MDHRVHNNGARAVQRAPVPEPAGRRAEGPASRTVDEDRLHSRPPAPGPESRPPGSGASRLSWVLLLAVAVVAVGMGAAVGWMFDRWTGALIALGIIAAALLIRALPVLVAAVFRDQDQKEDRLQR